MASKEHRGAHELVHNQWRSGEVKPKNVHFTGKNIFLWLIFIKFLIEVVDVDLFYLFIYFLDTLQVWVVVKSLSVRKFYSS